MRRDANGKFISEPHTTIELAAHPTDPIEREFERVLNAWRQQTFPEKLHTIMRNREALFSEASPEQLANYRQRAEAHVEQLVSLLQQGASEAVVLQAARSFYQECTLMKRVAPPPPTPTSELERVWPGMAALKPCGYRGVEREVLAVILKPGERITGFSIREIITSERTIARESLVRAACPTGMTKFDKWDAQFPARSEYDGTPPLVPARGEGPMVTRE